MQQHRKNRSLAYSLLSPTPEFAAEFFNGRGRFGAPPHALFRIGVARKLCEPSTISLNGKVATTRIGPASRPGAME
jgi:hypothetical protein